MFRKSLLVWLGLLALPSLACNVSTSASPTVPPAPILQSPVLGVNPVSGAPGTVITVSAAGFPAGAKVNLYLSTASSPNLQPSVEGLTVTPGGVLTFALQLPAQVGTTRLSGTIPVVLTVETTDKKARANAVFMASAPGGLTTTATVLPDLLPTPGDVSLGGQLYITSPAIGSVQTGGRIIVTGSGRAASNRVNAQVLDANNKILGSATATIQAASGAVGPWEVAVNFPQPATETGGYIVAYTTSVAGRVAEQSSIPIFLAAAGLPTLTPTVPPTIPPTVGPIIITATPNP